MPILLTKYSEQNVLFLYRTRVVVSPAVDPGYGRQPPYGGQPPYDGQPPYGGQNPYDGGYGRNPPYDGQQPTIVISPQEFNSN